ncbi:MAG: RrF2 family transcriptional regulator [Planctomycetia bacterium]|jgi:Rrf2 family cysteine metabolism transcriptional repressor
MRLSARTEYAAIAAVELARHWQAEEPVRIREISATQGVPARFLVHILLQLKQAGLVASTRGAAGGYRLARPPEEITLDDLRAAIEGPGTDVAPVTAALASRSRLAGALADSWGAAARAEADALRGTTLADLVARCRSGEAMYYI